MDPWQDQPGTFTQNWFKSHPKTTLCLLLTVIIVIVVISV